MVPRLHVRCKIPLPEAIVLSTQQDVVYPPLQRRLPNGLATISLGVDEKHARDVYNSRGGTIANYWVNTKVDLLSVDLVLDDLTDDELSRLEGHHPSAAYYTSQHGRYQEAHELGARIASTLIEACNLVVRAIARRFGQFWLKPIRRDESLQHFLIAIGAEWSSPGGWAPLFVQPPSSGGRIFLGVADQYLEISDWTSLDPDLNGLHPQNVGFSLVAEARQRFEENDVQVAIIHLNSALEWCVQTFLNGKLGPVIPQTSLETVLRQSHGRLLTDWVLPLVRQLGIDLESREWPSIRRIQELRAEAGHPSRVVGLASLGEQDFNRLAQDATVTIAKLLGVPTPKMPPPMDAAGATGTV
jgi:hypothetical protein